jgi:hypothetical protein
MLHETPDERPETLALVARVSKGPSQQEKLDI